MVKRKRGISRTTTWIIVAVVIIVVIVGGVFGYLATRPPSTTTTTTTPPTTITNSSGQVVFYTWWATTGKVALNHLIPAFESIYPNYKVIPSLVPGAGGTNAKFAILALIEAGKPPATFQTHMGPEMISYVEAAPQGIKSFVNITPIAEQMGLFQHAVPAVLEAGSFNGTILSMPVNVHRGSLLFVNWPLLKKYNLPFPYNFSTLVYDTEQLQAHGVSAWEIPGADSGWDQLNVWEDIFLSLAGPTMYNEITYGVLPMNSTVMHIINETNQYFLMFANTDYPGWQSITWTQGLTNLAQGKVAFQANGNWLTNYAYDFLNVTVVPATPQYLSMPNTTIVETPFPGTQNYYAIVIDSVGIPVGPSEQAGITLAKYWASWEGQQMWTKWKAVTFYNNVTTDYFNTPAQWADYQALLSTPTHDFVYQLSDGGLFDDVFGQLTSGMLAYQEAGAPGASAWLSTLNSSIHEEYQEWQAAAKLGLGFLGFPGHPFADYYPPWVKADSASSSSSSTWGGGYLILGALSIAVAEVLRIY